MTERPGMTERSGAPERQGMTERPGRLVLVRPDTGGCDGRPPSRSGHARLVEEPPHGQQQQPPPSPEQQQPRERCLHARGGER